MFLNYNQMKLFLFQILEFLKSREDFVGTLLRHIGTSAIMDLLLRLLTCIESPDIRRAMVEVRLRFIGEYDNLLACLVCHPYAVVLKSTLSAFYTSPKICFKEDLYQNHMHLHSILICQFILALRL